MATWLLEGDCFVDQFTDDIVADPRRMALAEKVEVRRDDAITARGAGFRHMVRVEVNLRNGERLERVKEAARGSETDFAGAADIVGKFEKLALHALPRAQVAELRDTVLGMEKLPDAARIADLMAQG